MKRLGLHISKCGACKCNSYQISQRAADLISFRHLMPIVELILCMGNINLPRFINIGISIRCTNAGAVRFKIPHTGSVDLFNKISIHQVYYNMHTHIYQSDQ